MSQCWAKVLLPIQSSRVMKKTTKIMTGQYLIWPVWENEVYTEEFAISGSPICIEIDSSRSTDIWFGTKEQGNINVFQLVSWSENSTEKVKLSVFPYFRERECSEFRRMLRMAIVLLYPSPCKAFYNTDFLCRFQLLCMLFHSQDYNFQCSQNFSPCKCLGAEK